MTSNENCSASTVRGGGDIPSLPSTPISAFLPSGLVATMEAMPVSRK